jgi:formate hydrogenlyase transcriptional activator
VRERFKATDQWREVHVAILATSQFGEQVVENRRFEQIVGNSPALEAVLQQVELVGPTDSTVLIQGETGTGKELIAQAIHNLSPRYGRPYIKLNCAAIPLDLLESELFGYEKGAFTGAIAQRVGRFQLADKGTLFLDEIGDIPPALQPKLLRVLQEQEFERLGSGRTHKVDIRLIAATHRDLAQMVNRKEFRSDLYYRLNVFPIEVPPLRERREDIEPLVMHFVNHCCRRMGKVITEIPPETLSAFRTYSWPGNIRELQNLIERAVILSTDAVLPNPLPATEVKPMTHIISNPTTLRDSERAWILETLDSAAWVVGGANGAAAKLGLKRTTLISKMKSRLRTGIPRTSSTALSFPPATYRSLETAIVESSAGRRPLPRTLARYRCITPRRCHRVHRLRPRNVPTRSRWSIDFSVARHQNELEK